MDDLGFVESVDGLGQSIVVAIAHAAYRGLDAGLRQALGVFDRDVLGGFKWSSQHLDGGGYDEPSKATFGSFWTDAIVFPRSTAGGRRLTSCSYRQTKMVLRRPLESTLAASVTVMHQPATMAGPPVMQSLLQGVEHQVRMGRS